MTLIATSRFNLASRAQYTSPMPPAPSGARIACGASDRRWRVTSEPIHRRRVARLDRIAGFTVDRWGAGAATTDRRLRDDRNGCRTMAWRVKQEVAGRQRFELGGNLFSKLVTARNFWF
jgi:hypothetical protein